MSIIPTSSSNNLEVYQDENDSNVYYAVSIKQGEKSVHAKTQETEHAYTIDKFFISSDGGTTFVEAKNEKGTTVFDNSYTSGAETAFSINGGYVIFGNPNQAFFYRVNDKNNQQGLVELGCDGGKIFNAKKIESEKSKTILDGAKFTYMPDAHEVLAGFKIPNSQDKIVFTKQPLENGYSIFKVSANGKVENISPESFGIAMGPNRQIIFLMPDRQNYFFTFENGTWIGKHGQNALESIEQDKAEKLVKDDLVLTSSNEYTAYVAMIDGAYNQVCEN